MAEILEPGLFTQMFTSMVEEGAADTASMMNTLADLSVACARELLLTYRADVLGVSTSPRGEPLAFRSGTCGPRSVTRSRDRETTARTRC